MKLVNIIIAILVLGGAFFLLTKENESAINSCIAAGNTKTYCEYHAG
jgi:hypothetical protein